MVYFEAPVLPHNYPDVCPHCTWPDFAVNKGRKQPLPADAHEATIAVSCTVLEKTSEAYITATITTDTRRAQKAIPYHAARVNCPGAMKEAGRRVREYEGLLKK